MSTSWTVSAGEILSRLDSMEPGAATADAAEIARIAAAADAVAQRLAAAFDDGELTGAAATGAQLSGDRLAERISRSASGLRGGQNALTRASTILGRAQAMRPRVMATMAAADARGGAEMIVRTMLAADLTGAYNAPMAGSAAEVTPQQEFVTAAGAGGSQVGEQETTAGRPASSTPPSTTGDRGEGVGWQPDTAANTGTEPSTPADGSPTSTAPGSAPDQNTSTPGPAGDSPTSGAPGAAPSSPGGPSPTMVPASLTSPVSTTVPRTPTAPGIGPIRSAPLGPGSATLVRPGTVGQSAVAQAKSVPSTPGTAQTGLGANPARSGQLPYGAGPAARPSATGTRGNRGQGSDDGYRPADYLRSTAEGMLLLGPAPVVGPSVIGAVATPAMLSPDGEPDLDADDSDDDDQELDLTL